MSAVEVKAARSGKSFAVARGGFPNPKDAPRDTPMVWYGITFFGDAVEQAKNLMKGDNITFKGKVESNNYVNRNGEAVTAPQLLIYEVLSVQNNQNQSTSEGIKSIGKRFGQTDAPKSEVLEQPFVAPQDDEEDMPF